MEIVQLLCRLAAVCIQIAAAGVSACIYGGIIEVIDEDLFICCDGKQQKYKNGTEQRCCTVETKAHGKKLKEQVLYNPMKNLCCAGHLFDYPQHEGSEGRPLCCEEQVLEDPQNGFCCNGRSYRWTEYAYCYQNGNISFPVSQNEIVCAKGTLVKIYTREQAEERGWDCCGTDLFDKNKNHFCYRDKLWPLGTTVSRCGETDYDTTQKVCCHDNDAETLISKPRASQAKYLGIDPVYGCLNGELVDKDLEYVSQAHVIPNNFKPCGDTYYDPNNSRTHVECCNGVVNHAKPGMDVSCCGTEFIDNAQNNCCDNKKLPTSEMCCGRTYDTCNITTAAPYNRYSSRLECCGNQLIDSSSHLCCKPQSSIDIVTLKQKRSDNACCGNTTYNPLDKNTCCGKKLYQTLDQNQICNRFGEIVTILEPNPEDISHKIKKLPAVEHLNVVIPGQFRELHRKCPVCVTYGEPPNKCSKKFAYQVYIRKVEKTRLGSRLHILLLEPHNLRKTKLVLKTTGRCRCFKTDEIYTLFTNRNIFDKLRRSDKLQLRITERDVFSIVTGSFGKYRFDHTCTINRYLKQQPIVS